MFRPTSVAAMLGMALILSQQSRAAVSYTGGVYSQNFDTLPNGPRNSSLGSSPLGWTDDNSAPGMGNYSIVGWYLYNQPTNSEGGFNGNQRLRVSGTPTTAATGSFYAYGDADSAERALGAVPSGTIAPSNEPVHYGLRLTNNTAETLTQFSVDYAAEQWRVAADVGGRPAGNQSVDLAYRLGGADLQSGGFTPIAGGGFDSIFDTSTSGTHLDGNDPANRLTGQGGAVAGIAWAPGTDLWLRWSQLNTFSDAGELADHGLAIDDLSFAAQVPEPAPFSMAAITALIVAIRARRD